MPKARRRDEGLHPAYEMREVMEYGTGLYPVNRTTGDVCDCKMKWNEDGTKLSCPVCGLDGT
jgi:hypothetical protein